MTYNSKLRWGLVLVFIISPLFLAFANHRRHQWVLAWPVATILIFFIFTWPQKYRTSNGAIRIRAGLTKRVIQWPEITAVFVLTHGNNIMIKYSGRKVVIAPDDQLRFLEEVALHCPQLSRRGFNLVLASHSSSRIG